MYQALYRKYRPINFDSVVGQDSIIRTLKNSIINKTFTHAYMFFGPRGTGKTTISKIFARSINCLEPVDGIACGKCKNCVESFKNSCVDIIEIDAASNNGVDEIRELRSKVALVPAELKYKVYIIDEVHMLSIGAFNALLKTLEEPPEHVVFILATTDPQKVPETIISRCQCFSFKRISSEMIVERLKFICSEEKIDVENDVLNEIALSSEGGMRDALGTLDKLVSYSSSKITLDDFYELNGMITKNDLKNFYEKLFCNDISGVLSLVNDFSNKGKNLIQIFSQIMISLRNLLVDYYINDIKCPYDIDLIQDFINLINENLFDIKKSGNPKIFIEMLLIKYIKEHNLKKDNNLSNNLNNSIKTQEFSVIEKKLDEYDTSENLAENISQEIIDENISREIKSVDNNFKIKNLNEIIDARVNNVMALADKNILKTEMQNFDLLNNYTFDQKIGYLVCSLLDAKLRAASKDSIILSYEYESNVEQNLMNLNKIIDVYNKITNSNKTIAIISDERWINEKNKYIKSLKDGNKYQFIEEPEEVLEEAKNDDIISSSAIELFGDIVEVE